MKDRQISNKVGILKCCTMDRRFLAGTQLQLGSSSPTKCVWSCWDESGLVMLCLMVVVVLEYPKSPLHCATKAACRQLQSQRETVGPMKTDWVHPVLFQECNDHSDNEPDSIIVFVMSFLISRAAVNLMTWSDPYPPPCCVASCSAWRCAAAHSKYFILRWNQTEISLGFCCYTQFQLCGSI